jgi:hypothetical protein
MISINKKLLTKYGLILLLLFSSFFPTKALALDTIVPTDPTQITGSSQVTGSTPENESSQETGTVNESTTTQETVPAQDTPPSLETNADTATDSVLTNEFDLTNYNMVNTTTDTVQRPYIQSIKVNVIKFRHKIIEENDRNDRYETEDVDIMLYEDMTRVPLKPTFIIDLSVDGATSITNPFTIYDKNFKIVPSDFSFISTKQIKLLLKDNIELEASRPYYIMLNPSLISGKYNNNPEILKDISNNDFYPLIKKFTTVSETVSNTDLKNAIDEQTAEVSNQPHGFYNANVNTCSNCHSTHVADNEGLDNPNSEYRKKVNNNSYCMACHDGTIVAPLQGSYNADNLPIKSEHNAVSSDSEHISSAGPCTSCHNPHLTWSKENPNLLKDYDEYTHDDSDMYDGKQVGKIDTRIQTCETCHQRNTNFFKKLAKKEYFNHYIYKHSDDLDVGEIDSKTQLCESCHLTNSQEVKNNSETLLLFRHDAGDSYKNEETGESSNVGEINMRVQECVKCHKSSTEVYERLADKNHPAQDSNKVLHYQRFTSLGQSDNYNLCFSCHNGQKEGTTNILQYYQDLEHDNVSKHNITAVDGSQLNGYLPCAECHESHNSTNLKLLKSNIGHEKQTEFTITESADWTDKKKREFCLSCHNGKTTIYGVGGKEIFDENGETIPLFDETTGEPIDPTKYEAGHIKDSSEVSGQVCSECHSENDSFIESVHAPKSALNKP